MSSLRAAVVVAVTAALGLVVAAPASAGIEIVPTHLHADAACNVEAWSHTACGHITNEAQRITGPGTVGPADFDFVASQGTGAELYDISTSIPGGTTRGVQAGSGAFETLTRGSFFYEMAGVTGMPVLAAVRVGIYASETRETTNECIPQRWVWCERTREYDTGRDTQADFTLSTRPLLIEFVNNTPNPIRRPIYGTAVRGFLDAFVGDTMWKQIPPGGSGWMGGLRRRGDASCPTDPATGKPEAGCVATKLARTTVGAYLRIEPQAGLLGADYAGGEVSFSISVRTDGDRTSRCTAMYRPTLPPLTCTVEFGGSNDGVTTATVTLKAAGT